MSDRVRAFFEQLFAQGAVRVDGAELLREEEVESAVEWIIQADLQTREHWPAAPPDVDRRALTWATHQFFTAAQLTVYRQLGPVEIERRLEPEFSVRNDDASMAYSVDVVFRYLPDLFRIVKGMNPDDPLLAVLRRWGERWPLSSVGIVGLSEINIEPILTNRCLSLMYVDRIVEAEATDRLDHPQVRELVREAIGAFPELSPNLYRWMTTADATKERAEHG
ncbi:MAG: hypothetical protein U0929_15145 [Planctomycetaceae bacterium]